MKDRAEGEDFGLGLWIWDFLLTLLMLSSSNIY